MPMVSEQVESIDTPNGYLAAYHTLADLILIPSIYS